MSTLTTQELQQQYIAYFGRPGDPQGIEYWLNESDITTAKEFALKISAQDEYANGIGAEPVTDQVNALYVNLFGRSADADGLIYWTNQVTKGVLSLGNLAYDLIVAAGNPVEGNEGQAALDAAALTKKTAAAQLFTDNVKAGGFILDYDTEEAFEVARSFVTTVKADSQFTVEQLTTFTQTQVVAMSNASKAAAAAATATAATPAATLSVVEQAQLQAAQAQTAAAQAELAVAQQAAAEAAAAKAEAAAAAEAALNAPTAYKLTKTTDNLEGAGGDDTFSGVIQAATADGTTAFPGDSIDGGDGNDTLTISVAGANTGSADYALNAVTLDNVEKVLISNFESTNLGGGGENFNLFDAGLWTGVSTVGVNASSVTGDTTFRAFKNFVDAEMRNGEGSLVIDYSGQQSVAGEEDVQNLTVSGTTDGNFTANKIETINITSELIKSTLNSVASDRLGKLTVSGDQNLTVTATGLTWYNPQGGTAIDGTVDASEATGKVSLAVGGNAATLSVTGGSGDDTFDFAGTLEKNDVVDGGEGSDTVAMDRQAAALTTEFDKVTGIEKFAVNTSAANTAIDVAKLPSTVTTLTFDLNDTIAAGNNTTTDALVTNVADGTTFILKKTTLDNADFDADDGANLTVTEASDTTSNSVNVVLDAVNNRADSVGGAWSEVVVENYETIDLESKRNKAGTVTHNELGILTATSAKDITVTGDADITIGSITGSKLRTFDATGVTGKVVLTDSSGSALGTDYKGPNAQTTFNLGTTLNNKDTVEGGTNSKDEVTATATGLTATTGALTISGIETIDLDTTGANTLDVSGISGATTLEVSGNIQTITGFDLASGLILKADDVVGGTVADATFKITPTDASGTDDSITIARTLGDDNNGVNTVELDDVETLNLVLEDTDNDTAGNDNSVWNLTKFKGTSIVVTEGANDVEDVDAQLGTLYKTITSVDTSAMKGDQSATGATDALAGITFKGAGGDIASFTGTEWNDTFTIGKTAGVVHVLSGGAGGAAANGIDSATVTITTGWTNPSQISTENLTLDVDPGKDITVAAAGFNAATTTINITGGNSLSTFENSTNDQFADAVEVVDASEFGGNVLLEFTDNNFDNTVTVTGSGSSSDDVIAAYTTDNVIFKPKSTDIYELVLSTTLAGTNSTTVNLADTTGTKKVTASLAAADTLILDKIDGQSVKLTGALTTAVLNPKLADDSGSSDTLTIEVKGANAGAIADAASITASDIETVTIKSTGPAAGETIGLGGLSMDAANKTLTVKITGNDPLMINSLGEDVDTIDASGMTEGGSFMQVAGGRSRTKSSTYTGSLGNDAFIMSHKDDVLDGAAHTASTQGDRLVLDNNMELLLGGLEVDLSKADDVLISFNGLGNSSVQKNFESVDLSNAVGNGFGSIITAAKTGSYIAGLSSGDNSRDIILGGDGDDTILGGDGPDKITPGAGTNTIQFSGTAHLDAGENYISGTGTDTFELTATTDFSGLQVDSNAAGTTVITGLDGITIGEGFTATFTDEQLHALTAVTVAGTNGGGVETLAVELSAGGETVDLSGFSAAAALTVATVTITGGTGADTITGMGAFVLETINPGTGAANDTVNLGTAGHVEVLNGMGLAGTSTVASGGTSGNGGGQANSVLAATETFIFANGVDTVTGFQSGGTGTNDDFNATSAGAATDLIGVAQNADLIAGTTYVAYGTWAPGTNTFTTAATGSFSAGNVDDALVVIGDAGTLTMDNTTGYVLFTDLPAVFAAADIAKISACAVASFNDSH